MLFFRLYHAILQTLVISQIGTEAHASPKIKAVNATYILMALGGIFWTIAYIDIIRIGIRDKTYGMPFWALAINLAWEFTNVYFGYKIQGFVLQTNINIVWMLFDFAILYTFIRYGRKFLPKGTSTSWFYIYTLTAIAIATITEYLMMMDLGFVTGTSYTAFLQNLMMSVLFLYELYKRKSSNGQSMLIAVTKWLATLFYTIVFGFPAFLGIGETARFVLFVGLCCSLFDIIYVIALYRVIREEKRGDGKGIPLSAVWRL